MRQSFKPGARTQTTFQSAVNFFPTVLWKLDYLNYLKLVNYWKMENRGHRREDEAWSTSAVYIEGREGMRGWIVYSCCCLDEWIFLCNSIYIFGNEVIWSHHYTSKEKSDGKSQQTPIMFNLFAHNTALPLDGTVALCESDNIDNYPHSHILWVLPIHPHVWH